MNKHTPGPWKWVVEYIDENYNNIQEDYETSDHCDTGNVRLIYELDGKDYGVADAWRDPSGDYYGISIYPADARLIAAAPELLAALQGILKGIFDGPDDSDAAMLIAKARDAVNKATGA
jgi:hypothetical protein